MGDLELLLISQGFCKLGIVYISFMFYPLKSCLRLELNDNKNECKLSVALQLPFITGAIILLSKWIDVLLDL